MLTPYITQEKKEPTDDTYYSEFFHVGIKKVYDLQNPYETIYVDQWQLLWVCFNIQMTKVNTTCISTELKSECLSKYFKQNHLFRFIFHQLLHLKCSSSFEKRLYIIYSYVAQHRQQQHFLTGEEHLFCETLYKSKFSLTKFATLMLRYTQNFANSPLGLSITISTAFYHRMPQYYYCLSKSSNICSHNSVFLLNRC